MRPDLICLQNTFSVIWQSSSTLLDINRSRVFPRLFTHGGDLSPPYGGGTSAGGQSVNGGLMRGAHEGGDIDLMGGPSFDRLYHKLEVLLLLSCNYMMQFVSYDSIKSR